MNIIVVSQDQIVRHMIAEALSSVPGSEVMETGKTDRLRDSLNCLSCRDVVFVHGKTWDKSVSFWSRLCRAYQAGKDFTLYVLLESPSVPPETEEEASEFKVHFLCELVEDLEPLVRQLEADQLSA